MDPELKRLAEKFPVGTKIQMIYKRQAKREIWSGVTIEADHDKNRMKSSCCGSAFYSDADEYLIAIRWEKLGRYQKVPTTGSQIEKNLEIVELPELPESGISDLARHMIDCIENGDIDDDLYEIREAISKRADILMEEFQEEE